MKENDSVLIITNIPTPYRTAFFNVLNSRLTSMGVTFNVFYCGLTEPRRYWKFEPEENFYPYKFLDGFRLDLKGLYLHINYFLYKEIKKINPKYIIMAGSWNAPSVLNIVIRKGKLNAKILFWSEGHKFSERNSSYIVRKLRKFVFGRMDAFLVPNESSKNYIVSYKSNALVGFLPNTIDEDFFNPELLMPKNLLKEKLGYSSKNKIIIQISTLNDRKGVLELIKGYCLLSTAEKNLLTLIIVGTGELYKTLIEIKNSQNLENVFIVGYKEVQEVRDLLHISDVFVLPTKLDPNPLTPIEAAFMGKSLMLSIFAGNFNELNIENNGFKIDKIDESLISINLRKIIEFPSSDLDEMGKKTRNMAIESFSRINASNALIKFLRSL